ncbi:MAG: helicase-related protein, partial [Heliobacteriaceae bacterium]|nr:helicase-related protein [Heliobacteriaceae bacterium]
LTGDHQINRLAPIIVMTTEIFRNMLIEKDVPGELSHVVFDEIHYLNDPERGAVWEECLILLPPQVRFLGLSATVPNIGEIAEWLSHVHDRKVPVVRYLHRHVPLGHFYYQKALGLGLARDMVQLWEDCFNPPADLAAQTSRDKRLPWQCGPEGIPPTSHRSLVACLASLKLLPTLYFLFSRKGCEQAAREWAGYTFLGPGERQAAAETLNRLEERWGSGLAATGVWAEMRDLLARGIGYHHAGLPPIVKQAVEDIFSSGLVRVLYTTETFAVGINYPVKTVCLDSNTKFDGTSFRVLTGTEYHQMAGRAGRRGMDEQGLVIVRADYQHFSPDRFPHWPERRPEPIRSRFTLAFNTVVNLAAHHSAGQVDKILSLNLKVWRESAAAFRARERLQQLDHTPALARCSLVGEDACPVNRRLIETQLRTINQRLRSWAQHKGKNSRVAKRRALALEKQAELTPRLKGLPTIRCDRKQRVACEKRVLVTGDYVQARRQATEQLARSDARIREVAAEYERMVNFLVQQQYLTAAGNLLPRGAVLSKLHVEELLVAEWVFEGLLQQVDEVELAALIGGVVYEEGRFEVHVLQAARHLGDWLNRARSVFFRLKDLVPEGLPQPHFRIEGCWYIKTMIETPDWRALLATVNMTEGDMIALARRAMDVLRQLARAVEDDEALHKKVKRAQDLVARPEVVAGL